MKTKLKRQTGTSKVVSVDSCLLTAIVNGACSLPVDPVTKQPIPDAHRILDYWFKTLSQNSTQLVISTPVLSEVIHRSGLAVLQAVGQLKRNRAVAIKAFGEREAIELAEANRHHSKPRGKDASPWQKVKLDRQIAAVAKCCQVDIFYTMDGDLKKAAEQMGLVVHAISDMPKPPAEQRTLFAGEHAANVMPISPGR